MRGEKNMGSVRGEKYTAFTTFWSCKKDIEISECSYYTDAIKN